MILPAPHTARDRRDGPLHVVLVDEELPYPPNSGKRIRTLNLTLRLARRHRLTYVCHRNADPGVNTGVASGFHFWQGSRIGLARPHHLPARAFHLDFYSLLGFFQQGKASRVFLNSVQEQDLHLKRDFSGVK